MDHSPDQSHSLTRGGFRLARGLLLLFAAGMIGISFYLSYHYFSIHFPTSLLSTSYCDISAFWNCDLATLSPLASIGPLPTAAVGILVGWLLLLAGCFPSREAEASAYLLALVNFLGCLGLFAYSLFVLGGLCPGCMIYYGFSLVVLMLFWFNSDTKLRLYPRPVGVALASALLILGGFAYKTREELSKINEVAAKMSADLEEAPNFESFGFSSPFILAKATEKFADAPLRVTIFSDFQCPICRVFAEMLPKISGHFKGQLNMQYFSYPIDNACNPQVRETFHPLACEAAYVAVCARERFGEVHDELYANQEKFSKQWLQQLANRYELSTCYHSEQPARTVTEMFAAAEAAGIKATPTVIVNGKKLEGLLPLKLMIMVMEGELAKSRQSRP